MSLSLQGKTALITAGANGIGLQIAQTFSNAGAKVAICDVDEAALEAVREAHPEFTVIAADVSREEEVARLFKEVTTAFSGLDLLINNAGISGPTGRVDTLEFSEWKQTLDINISGQFLCTKAAVPYLLKSNGAAIVNLSSIAGHMGVAGRTPYAASKWAVVGFTKSVALELGPEGIRVNCILPGIVAGPRIDRVIAAKAEMHNTSVEEMSKLYTQHVSLGQFVNAQDIANMALFLCSDAAANVHGQEMVVDGYTEAVY